LSVSAAHPDLGLRFEALVLHSRLQNISTTGVDSRGQEGTPGDSIDGEKRLGIEILREKSCAISQLVDRPGSGSIPAASTNVLFEIKYLQGPKKLADTRRTGLRAAAYTELRSFWGQ
jgi:hypothetical protein